MADSAPAALLTYKYSSLLLLQPSIPHLIKLVAGSAANHCSPNTKTRTCNLLYQLCSAATLCFTLQVLLSKGVEEGKILFLSLIAAPEGIHRICAAFPRVKVITSEIDEGIGADFQVIPGIQALQCIHKFSSVNTVWKICVSPLSCAQPAELVRDNKSDTCSAESLHPQQGMNHRKLQRKSRLGDSCCMCLCTSACLSPCHQQNAV